MEEIDLCMYVIRLNFGKRNLFDKKNIILRYKQLKMPNIYITIANRTLVYQYFYDIIGPVFLLTIQCDKLLLGHHLELS